MSSKWQRTILNQLGRIITGKTPPSAFPEYFGNEIPFVTPTDFDGRRFIEKTSRFLSHKGAQYLQRCRIPRGAVMVSCIGSDMGKAAIAGRDCVTNQQINSIIVESGDEPLFVYYNLSMRKEEIRNLASGSAQPILNKSAFGQLEIILPPLSEQRAIAHILGTLDDKIELNRRMNETLEQMARALFKAWFVDFEPVRAKMEGRWKRGQSLPGMPAHLYDLFPDRLVLSELGEIPEGWRIGTIGDLANITSGKRPLERYPKPIPGANVPLWGGNGPMAYVREPLFTEPILLTGRVGTLGSVFRITIPCWPSDNTLVILPWESINYEYLFFQMQRIDYDSLNRGSTQPLITQTDLKTQNVLIPPTSILQVFHRNIASLFGKIDVLLQESRTLSDLRDTLLPKLINGEIRTGHAERFLKENKL